MSADDVAGDTSVAVLTGNSCIWTAKPAVSWLVVTDGAKGTGNGTVKYAAEPNPDTQDRRGTISVNTKVFTMTQRARDATSTGGDSGGDTSGGGGKPVAALVDARLFERIRRMQARFDALCQRIESGFAKVTEEEGLAEIHAAVKLDRKRSRAAARKR